MRRLGLTGTIGALLSALILTIIFAVPPGFAADPQRKGKVAAPASQSDDYLAPAPAAMSWTGLYLSAGLGIMGLDDVGENTICRLGGGYDHQIAGTRIVAGVFGDWTIPCRRGEAADELDGSWYGGVRLGALLTDHLLGYASAGYTVADLAGGTERLFTMGAGAELMVTKHFSFKLDWRRGVDQNQDEVTGFLNFRF